jgi:hypothetical protein
MSFTTFYEEYNNMFYDYHYLPIVEDINNEYRSYSDDELMRLPKSTGGLVESGEVSDKYPVPFVKKDPKARVSDDLGGEPYQEQMNILGFKK